jgi:hypothetical protein
MICQDRLGTSARETAPQNRTHAKRRRFPHREAEHCRNEEQHCRCIDLVHLVLRCHDGKARPEKSQKPRAHRRAVIHRHPRAVALHLPAKNVEDAHREGGGPREPVEPQHHSEDGAAVETCAGREETAPWFWVFQMLVPSLSWQMIGFRRNWRIKSRVLFSVLPWKLTEGPSG